METQIYTINDKAVLDLSLIRGYVLDGLLPFFNQKGLLTFVRVGGDCLPEFLAALKDRDLVDHKSDTETCFSEQSDKVREILYEMFRNSLESMNAFDSVNWPESDHHDFSDIKSAMLKAISVCENIAMDGKWQPLADR